MRIKNQTVFRGWKCAVRILG